ncbi:MAG TPA: HAD-IA family hydrolase, partial [Desulfobacteraceae bacterium]|nr:HAD-IA family hydrolase [Desulfobacteraceae bacterium]
PHMKMAPGLKQLLDTLSAGNYIRGVATNRTDTMATVLQANGLEASFDMVVTAADVARPKPEPDQLLAILTRFGLKPDEMVFIGDSIYDAKAAARAGVFFIAFGNPSLEADFQAGSMADVGGILKLDGGI